MGVRFSLHATYLLRVSFGLSLDVTGAKNHVRFEASGSVLKRLNGDDKNASGRKSAGWQNLL